MMLSVVTHQLLAVSRRFAELKCCTEVEPIHLFLAALKVEGSVGRQVVQSLGGDPDAIISDVLDHMRSSEDVLSVIVFPYSQSSQAVLSRASDQSRKADRECFNSGDLFQVLLAEESVKQFLKGCGVWANELSGAKLDGFREPDLSGYLLTELKLANEGVLFAVQSGVLLLSDLCRLLNNGQSVLSALHEIEEHSPSEKIRAVASRLSIQLQMGKSLSLALAEEKEVFSRATADLVNAAERLGILCEAIELLARTSASTPNNMNSRDNP